MEITNIENYKPSQKIIDKLMDYRAKGSTVNVHAITSTEKKLTYYYASILIGWSSLTFELRDVMTYAEEQIANMIGASVVADENLKDTRTEDVKFLQEMFKNVANYLVENNIDFKMVKRKSKIQELDKDIRNGKCWTLSYSLILNNKNEIMFCHHTSEACDGSDYRWGWNGFTGDFSKKEIEKRLMERIHYFMD